MLCFCIFFCMRPTRMIPNHSKIAKFILPAFYFQVITTLICQHGLNRLSFSLHGAAVITRERHTNNLTLLF